MNELKSLIRTYGLLLFPTINNKSSHFSTHGLDFFPYLHNQKHQW